ncbi:Serine/threonine-protein kinase TOR [Capsicum baccatum]|uniref:Serine/threonine-protein kinase TOR n=1 Tax=Capsicum baccatum TaxID=33114 RepID=A0A2G2V6D5_CAPBA|nr:Serine/threonine-protein kinase TOR [Capsicum baccatum]
MGSSSQAIRYPVATTGAGNIDALNRVLPDLCTRSNSKDGAALTLSQLVEEEARDLSGEAFVCFMDHLYECITTFLDGNEVSENLGVLRAIYELIDVNISENASKLEKFSNYRHAVFEIKCDPKILVLASKVLSHLARSGGVITADEVECQVKFALEWLRGKRIEYRRFATVLILKEMAENASIVFNVHVPMFVDAIWVALRDPTNTGEFMMSRYRKFAEIILRYLEHRDRLVRLRITSLLPRIVHFLRDQFVTNYLMICMNHILHVLKIPAERASGFISLGEMAGALDGELINYLPTISSHLRDAALACVGNIAKAIGPTMEPHVRGLLDSMFSSGLSLTLVEALEQITESFFESRDITTVTPQVLELSGSALVQLALRTLARFNFKGYDFLEFVRESVVVYLEDEDGATKKDAALRCCKLVANSFSAIFSTQFSPSRINCASGKRRHRVVEEVAVTDSPILATPGSIIDLRFSNASIPSHILVLAFPVLPKEEDEESKTEPDEEEFEMDADLDNGREVEIEGVDVLDIEEASVIQLAEVNGVDSLEKDVEQGKHDLVETEKVSVVPAEGNESDSSERDLD